MLFVGIFLPLTIVLGFWQLDRAEQKRQMADAYLNQLTQLPQPASAQRLAEEFSRVRLEGAFSHEIFLVDNQVLDGQPGYWLLQVFEDRIHGRFLVNRGYLPGTADRQQLPQVGDIQVGAGSPTPAARDIKVVGVVWPFTGLIPLLDDDEWSEQWPVLVQRLDIQRMAQRVNAMPVEIRLEPGQPGVHTAAPFDGVLKSEMHMGYAATWFGLAGALVICFFAFAAVKPTRSIG